MIAAGIGRQQEVADGGDLGAVSRIVVGGAGGRDMDEDLVHVTTTLTSIE